MIATSNILGNTFVFNDPRQLAQQVRRLLNGKEFNEPKILKNNATTPANIEASGDIIKVTPATNNPVHISIVREGEKAYVHLFEGPDKIETLDVIV